MKKRQTRPDMDLGFDVLRERFWNKLRAGMDDGNLTELQRDEFNLPCGPSLSEEKDSKRRWRQTVGRDIASDRT